MYTLVATLAACEVLLWGYWLMLSREAKRQRSRDIIDTSEASPRQHAAARRKAAAAAAARAPQRAVDREDHLPWPFSALDTLQQQAGEYEGPLRILLTAALAAVGLGMAAWLLVGQPLIVIGAALSGMFVPAMLLKRKAAKRMAAVEEQVSGACQVLIQAFYGGTQIDGALREAARDLAPPLGEELRAVLREVDSGYPMDAALARLPARVPGAPSVRMLVASLQIAHEMGANLGQHLGSLAELLRQRRVAEARVKSTVASARLQGKVLFFVPLLAYVWMHLQAPSALAKFQSPKGQLELLGMALWLVIGYVVTQGILANAFGGVL